jgi:hypothetical protein
VTGGIGVYRTGGGRKEDGQKWWYRGKRGRDEREERWKQL